MSESEQKYVDPYLKAEQEVNKILKEAYKEKAATQKLAKMAAEQEIAQFRKQEEERYQNNVKALEVKANANQDIDNQTKKDLTSIYKLYESNKKEVIQLLVERVMAVRMEIPEVLKRRVEEEEE
eukprot:TRINITY_DN341_c0_g1_i4.p2 TRINITY_DN341_c0_g1~~TRINITY_DN341_c0_g1_i4.p2  ORF type:complete len:124 (+),score=41.59 TRINITY_DN341_c0_g1_i4:237-608(+)